MRRFLGLVFLFLVAARADAFYSEIRSWTFDWGDWYVNGGDWYYNYHELGDTSRWWGENISSFPGLSDPPFAFCAEDGSQAASDYPGNYHCQMQLDTWYSLSGFAAALVEFETYVSTDRGRDVLSLWADRGSGWVKVFETSGWYGYRSWRVGLDGAGSGSSVRFQFRFDSESSWSGGAWVDNVTLYGSASSLPNLHARDFTCDRQQALANDNVYVTFTLENTSSVGVSNVSYGVYLAWWGQDIDPMQDSQLFTGTYGWLGPGESVGLGTWVNVGAAGGSYNIGVYVDDSFSVDEGNELDNSSTTTIDILPEDWYEDNDTFGAAREFAPAMTTEWGLTLTDEDWYYTTVQAGETLSVVADGLYGNVVLELRNASYNLLDTSALDVNAQICTWRNGTGSSATCYFRVYSPSGDWCWYDLTVKKDSVTEGYAIVLGVENYQGGGYCAYADEDATAIASALQSDPVWTQVTLYTDSAVTWGNVDSAISNVINNAGPRDRVVFYFSGLAGSPEYGASFLLYDGQDYECHQIRNLNKAGTRDLVVIFDADQAGRMVQDLRWGSFAQGLAATSHDGTVERLDQLGHGVFTCLLSKALTHAAADGDENYFITAEEAFAATRANLSGFSSQGAYADDLLPEYVPLIDVQPSSHSVTLDQPLGWEWWRPGTTHKILWHDTGIGGKVDIYFDGGAGQQMIAQGVPNTGVFNWLVPEQDVSGCYVLVRTCWGQLQDQCPGFTVGPKATPAADLAIVDVEVEDTGPNTKRIHLDIVNTGDAASPAGTVAFWNNPALPPGAPDTTQALWPLDPGDRAGGLWWDVSGPGVPETWASYTMVDYGNAVDEEHEDDNLWGPIPLGWQGETAPRISLNNFNGWDEVHGGVKDRISWSNEGVTGPWIMIELSTDGGGNWTTVSARAPNTGSFKWTPPQVSSGRCLLKLTSLSVGCADASDESFTIRALLPGVLGGGCGAGAGMALALLFATALLWRRR